MSGELVVDVWELKSVSLELLNVVKDVTDAVHGHLGQVVEPLVDNLEDALVLIGLANVLYDILTVGTIDTEHLRCIALILKLLEYLGVDCATELDLPAGLALQDHSTERDADDDEELLMDVEHQVLQVRINTRLRIDCCLFICEQVIELNDSNRDSLVLLSLQHDLFE